MNRLEQNKGITLIALIITIIVMLILAGVTITMAVNGGLFDYAGKAARKTEEAKNDEKDWAKLNENMSTDELIAKYTTNKKEDLERLKQIFEGKTEEEVDSSQFFGDDALYGMRRGENYEILKYHNNMYKFTIEGDRHVMYTSVVLLEGIQYDAMTNGKFLGNDKDYEYYKYNNKRYKIAFNEGTGEYTAEEYTAELKEVIEHESDVSFNTYVVAPSGMKKTIYSLNAYEYEDMNVIINDTNGYITLQDGYTLKIEGTFPTGYTTTVTLKGLQSGKTETITFTL